MNTITRLRVTPSEDTYADAMSSTGSKKLTKHMVEEIAGSISGEFPSGFPEAVLERISAAAYVATFADSRWCHHGIALVSETSCNSPLSNRSKLRDAYVGHRSPNHHGQPK